MEKENCLTTGTDFGKRQGGKPAHSTWSKGIEFEHVFFAGVNAYLWEKKKPE